ncbi:NXF [Acanthosepion pharaonis]|uniref:NXF n=1 Tax=Acanthosepion pharaonis TaxID=158019 RepID=A0A812DB74_ACAPH|nr:NXF [Sepia pharaonis]
MCLLNDKHRSFYKRSKWHGRGGRYSRKGGGGGNSRSRLDDDYPMDDGLPGSSDQRHSPYHKNRRNAKRLRRQQNKLLEMDKIQSGDRVKRLGLPVRNSRNSENWYKVKVPFGQKFDKKVLFQKIEKEINMPFQAIRYQSENEHSIFHVQDKRTAEAIRAADKKILMPNGYKLVLIVKPCNSPLLSLDANAVSELKTCMSERYDSSTKTLNLSNIYQSQSLQQKKLFLVLNRPQVFSHVVSIIKENIPELVSLDLSSNRLMTLDSLATLVPETPNLKHLNLGKNMLKTIEELEKIKGWKLDDLILEGNDLCDRFKEQSDYIRAVRKKYPKVLRLDGHELPPPIVFDLESATDLPPSKGNYFLNTDVQTLLVKFIKQYYLIYDSDNRQALIDAYHDQAMFSYACNFNRVLGKQPSLTDYISDSRNLLKINDARREKLLKIGRVKVVSQLRLLPSTQHDLNSLRLDVQHLSSNLLIFSVFGIFKETSKVDPPIRAFSRCFITTPMGQGIVIINDMLTITNATQEQIQSAFKTPAPTPSSSPTQGGSGIVEPSTSNVLETPGLTGANLTDTQQQMVVQFSAQSGMNAEYSFQCLLQNEWNYDKSAQIFMDLKAQGKIPDQAFLR